MKSILLDRNHKPFGRITVVLGGEFRQILLVINRAPRGEVVSASINRSRLWDECILYMFVNMRVNKGTSKAEKEVAHRFNQWVLDIGNGKIPSCTKDGNVFDDFDVQIPEEFCIKSDKFSAEDIINSTYPDLMSNYADEVYIRQRAILSPMNEVVHEVNTVILEKLPGQAFSYLSIDSAEEVSESEKEFNASFPNEYLNALNEPGLPPHNIISEVLGKKLMKYLLPLPLAKTINTRTVAVQAYSRSRHIGQSCYTIVVVPIHLVVGNNDNHWSNGDFV